MVEIGLVYDIARWEEKDLYKKAGSLGARIRLLKADEQYFLLDNKWSPGFEPDIFLQRCVSLYVAHSSTLALEALGFRVINDSLSIAIAGNKLWTTTRLIKAGVKIPSTIIGFSRSSVLKAAELLGYPVVVKPLLGSWGRLVARADNPEDLDTIIEHREYMGNSVYRVHYLQEYIKKPGRDIRVFVIGEEVPVAIYRASNNWKTNTALGGKAIPAKIDPELEELSIKAAKAVGTEIAGIDVFEDPEEGYVVNEVNHNTEYKNTVRVTGVDVSAKIIEYVIGRAKR